MYHHRGIDILLEAVYDVVKEKAETKFVLESISTTAAVKAAFSNSTFASPYKVIFFDSSSYTIESLALYLISSESSFDVKVSTLVRNESFPVFETC